MNNSLGERRPSEGHVHTAAFITSLCSRGTDPAAAPRPLSRGLACELNVPRARIPTVFPGSSDPAAPDNGDRTDQSALTCGGFASLISAALISAGRFS